MKHFISKKTIAMTMASAMMVSNCAIAFGDDINLGGTGTSALEYDNSIDISYDRIAVPVFTSDAYDITIDPTGALHRYRPSLYSEGSVYFHSLDSDARAKIMTSDGSTKLYTQKKEAVDLNAGAYDDIVWTSSGDIKRITGTYYVWVPSAEFTSNGGNKEGAFEKLTIANVENYFDIVGGAGLDSSAKDIKIKEENLFETGAGTVCDGKLYKDTYTQVLTSDGTNYYVEDDDFGKIKSFLSGGTTEFKNLYLESDGSVLASSGSVKYVEAKSKYQNVSDKVTVVNKSTKKKTVTAVVTMNSAAGLTFNSSADFSGVSSDASLYLAATNGETTAALKSDAGVIKATYEVNLDSAGTNLGSGAEITYMDSSANGNTGGHNFKRFEAQGVEYASDSFWITGAANTDEAAADAWEDYLKGINSSGDRPTLSVTYRVTDYVAEPAAPAAPETYTVTYNANYGGADPATKTEDVNVGSHPNGPEVDFTRTGYHRTGWSLTSSGVAKDLEEISDATTLYAIWVADDTYVMTAAAGAYSYTFVNAPVGSLTTFKVDGTARQGAVNAGNVTYADGKLTINAAATDSFELLYGNHTIEATIGEIVYDLTIVNPVMVAEEGTYIYTFTSDAPVGTLTALTIDGSARPGAVGAGYATYADGKVTFNTDMTSAFNLETGNHKVDVTIGSTVYKLYIAN